MAAQAAAKNPNSLNSHVSMFGYLAKMYKTDLIDPSSGKPPNLMKTINKMLETIYTFFKEKS